MPRSRRRALPFTSGPPGDAGIAGGCVMYADLAPVTPEGRFVDVHGVNVHYRDYGGDGDLMVLVPSFGMTGHVFDPIAPHLTDRYRVVGFTRRWHGTSDTTDLGFDLDTLVDDLAGFIDQVADGPAIVVGWSMAGLELLLPMKRPAWEGGGTSCADLAVAFGGSQGAETSFDSADPTMFALPHAA